MSGEMGSAEYTRLSAENPREPRANYRYAATFQDYKPASTLCNCCLFKVISQNSTCLVEEKKNFLWKK